MSETFAPRSIDRALRREVGGARGALVRSVVFGLLSTATLIAQLLFLAQMLAWAGDPAHHGSWKVPLVGFVIALCARVVISGCSEHVASTSATAIIDNLRTRLVMHLEAEGLDGRSAAKRGATTMRATRGLRLLEPYYARYLPALVLSALAPVAALVVLGVLDWPSALICLGLVAIVPFAMIRLGRKAAAESDRQWRRLSSMSGRFLELLRGIPTLRTLGATDRAQREVVAANEAVAQSVDATLRAALTSGAALEFLSGVGVGLVAMLAGLRLLHGSFSIPGALAVILLAPEVFFPLRRASAEFHAATQGRAAGAEVLAELATAVHTHPFGTAEPASPFPLKVEHLRLERAGRTVVDSCTFELGATGHLVLRGPSGSGKTTLLSAIGGLVPRAGGTIVLGGIPFEQIDPAWRQRFVSLIPQHPHVFAATLGENLSCFGDLNRERAREALDLVGLNHLLGVDGLETPLAEAGHSMSGGERQRLGLARAYLENRPIVLLDEPTAHLDPATVAMLSDRLSPWLSGRLVIESAHHQSLLDTATTVAFEIGL